MPIADGIIDLNPWIWWRLDDLTPGVVSDSSGHNIHGTSSSDLDYGVTGPTLTEPGIRFYSGGQIISPALGLSAWASTTIVWWATAPAAGGVATAQLLMNIGDAANRTARGWWANLVSPASDNMTITQRGTTAVTGIQAPYPRPYWHMYAWVRDAVANTTTSSVDGGTPVTGGTTAGIVWQTTDQLLLKADTPVVLSNVAIFDKVLSQAQLQSIATKVQPWPYIIPSNQIPVTTSGETDLTPVLTDTTQILADTTDILANWSAYQSVTLPSLAAVLNNIQLQFQTTIQTSGGPVIRSIAQVLGSALRDAFVERDLSGGVTCERVDADVSGGRLYAVKVRISDYPAEWRFQTPDNRWGFHDLAVLTFWRGGDVLARHGVHALSHTVSPLPGLPYPWATLIDIPQLPGDYHITVDWATGVCGQLVGELLP